MKKRGFTLIEVMTTLLIFSVALLLLISNLFQYESIIKKIQSRNIIQNEVRNMILSLQKELNNENEIIVNNSYGTFKDDKWLLDNTNNMARELLRVIKSDKKISTIYVEINIKANHKFIKFDIDDNNNIVKDSIKILINKINGNDSNAITIFENDNFITINCTKVVNSNDINELDYLTTIKKKKEILIEKNIK